MRSITGSSRSFATEDRRSVVSANSSNASTLVPESLTSAKTTSLRKFTAGVGRPGMARENREAVRNVITTQNPTRVPPIADPLDYEKFVTERSIQMENDAQRELLVFPRDDIQESVILPESTTEVPSVKAEDVQHCKWLITQDALKLYTMPHRVVSFNYANFAGDYNKVNDGSCIESDVALSSLVFESDMAEEEEKMAKDVFLANELVKEGYVMVMRSDSTLFDNLKSAKKRYCVLKRRENSDVTLEIRKTPTEAPKQSAIRINAAQIKSTKKGKTVLEIQPCTDSNGKSEQKTLMLTSEKADELNTWLLTINRLLALSNKCDSISTCSERFEKSAQSQHDLGLDSESIGSDDSNSSNRDVGVWRGRNTAARVLQPPIVDRHNMYSLYYHLHPLPEPRGDLSCVLRMANGKRSSAASPTSPQATGFTRKRTSSTSGSKAVRFAIEFKKLELKLLTNSGMQQVEPFFVYIFIFDAHCGRRISEEFQVNAATGDYNPSAVAQKGDDVHVNGMNRSVLTNPKVNKVICTVSTPHKDLWIVCRVDRCLSSDTSGDLYMKSSGDAKATQKLQKQIQQSICRLDHHKQRFAYAARPVFQELRTGENTNLNISNREPTTLQLPLYRCENNRLTEVDLQKYLGDFSKVEKTGKFSLPNAHVSIVLDLSARVSDFAFRVNPSLYPLRPWISPRDSLDPPAFELQSFGDVVMNPYSEFVNLLYVYPLSLKYDSQKVFSKARNIACSVRLVRGDGSISNCIFDRCSADGPFNTHSACSVQYHQQNPSFGDEVKIRLPLDLSSSDHILFSFSHVSVAGQTSAKSPDSPETPIGYAWLPLVKNDHIVMVDDEQEFGLQVASELPAGYQKSKRLGFGKGDECGDVKWVDPQRCLFRVRLRLISSAFTSNVKLHSFFQACQRLENQGVFGDSADYAKSKSASPGNGGNASVADVSIRSCSPLASRSHSFKEENTLVKDLIGKTSDLIDVDITKLVPFLPIVLSRLFALLTETSSDLLAQSTLRSIISICDRCASLGNQSMLRMFIRRHLSGIDSSDESTHGAICKHLPMMLRAVQSNIDELAAVYRQLWFLLDAAAKSMAQAIINKTLYKCSRKDRFSAEFIDHIGQLVETLIPQLIAKHKELPKECRQGNTSIAFFIRCCLSYLDRGSVFKWLHFFIKRLDEHDSKVLRDYKADVLHIIIQHEHYLPLCLPVLIDGKGQITRVNYQSITQETSTTTTGTNSGFLTRFLYFFQSPSLTETTSESDRYGNCADEWFLSTLYSSRHFLTGLLLQELCACLREPREYRRRPIALLRNIMAKHSYDRRYADVNMQRRIAILYAPLLRFALDHIGEIVAATRDSNETSHTGVRTHSKWQSLDDHSSTLTTNSSILLGTSSNVESTQMTPLAEKLDIDEVQDLLTCVLYVIHRLPKRILGVIWSEGDGIRAKTILRLMDIILDVFKYRGLEHSRKTTSKEVRGTRKSLHLVPPSSSRLPSVDLNVSNASDMVFSEDEDISIPFGILQLVNLSQEVALVVLEALQTFAQQLSARRTKLLIGDEELFCRLLTLHLNLLEEHWPEAVRLHTIAALALFINLFRVRLFDGGPLDAISLLIERLLLQMASRLSSVQNAAAALLQLVLRAGYEAAENHSKEQALLLSVSAVKKDIRKMTSVERLGRPGAQTGVALARLLGSKSVVSTSGRFEKGLSCLETLVDVKKGGLFDKAVADLIRQLRGVMTATVALKDAANDAVRLADLHIQLADSYRGSAALRSAWFEACADNHVSENWYAEAAVCYAHSVAIIAKELRGETPIDWSVFSYISNCVARNENLSEPERTVQPAGFTIENLMSKVEKTAQCLTLAERFEAIGPLYRVLIPFLEKNNSFNSLISVYAELQQSYSRAAEVKSSGKRHLGAYFRVKFYGLVHFGNDHNTEWIYREPGLTSLAEASLRLKDACKAIVGHDRVVIEPKNEMDTASLDSSTAYVQITHVEPKFEPPLNAKHFWSNTNISEFFYECPVFEGEKTDKEPGICMQALKKVLLKVDGEFPSTRRRLRVISSTAQVFSPLEFACQKLSVKASQIRDTLASISEGRPLDIKGLQLLLQGAVMPTVNAGPLAYAESFTQAEQKNRYGDAGINKLLAAFKDLLSACDAALQANESAIGPDQLTYHQVLKTSFEAMHERLTSYFGVSLRDNGEEKPPVPKSAIHILDSISGLGT